MASHCVAVPIQYNYIYSMASHYVAVPIQYNYIYSMASHYVAVPIHYNHRVGIDSISKDERGFPLTQYITNGRISRGGYTFTHYKHHHRVLRLISYSMSV